MNELNNHFPHSPQPLFTSKFTIKEKTMKPIREGAHVHPDTKGQPELKKIIIPIGHKK